jgi:ATP-dependent 26S proteasome regulatory subunit
MGTQIYYDELNDNYGDDKHYCWNHKKMIVRDYKKKKADKIKEEKKNLKLKEKEELQKAKDEAKQKAKEEKEKVKEELKKSVQLAKQNKKTKTVTNDNTIVIDLTNENVVISHANAVDANVVQDNSQVLLCQEILKSGKNKGTHCGNKVFENNLCKRHINKQLTANI